MDIYTLQEETYKRGFEAGYIRGCADNCADVMNGVITWHDGFPQEDQSVCFICYKNERTGKYLIRPAVYRHKNRVYFVDEFAEDGGYYQVRIPRVDVKLWAEVKIPFSFRTALEGLDDGEA